MNISDFDFTLPPELIAHYPANPRDSSRLLIVDTLEEKQFADLPRLLRDGDLLVFNNSKVIPARLFVKKGEAKIEIFLHKKLGNKKWQAFAKPGKKLKIGDILSTRHPERSEGSPNGRSFAEAQDDIKVIEKLPSGDIIVELENEKMIFEKGHIPLPPYINRPDEESDKINYQTVYAKTEGSVAAPTAGLHFTQSLLDKIPNKAFVTLHVGAGTFQPVKTENLDEHKMHSEWYEISKETEEKIRAAKRVIAIGTTSLRVLEASNGKSGSGETDIFIKPGYKFKVAHALITNFHLPKSTLFILTCAMAGTSKMKGAYGYAIKNHMRFFSYGDACFIEKS